MTELELYFQYRCQKGLEKRGLTDKSEYQKRLKYEISVITTMGYCGYFLVVSDLLTWTLANEIPVGPGRGSAAGALVAYVLEITHLDPIEHGLIFERFLNPDRVSMPDIDMDFCEDRRGEVIGYAKDKYGHDKVAHIGTYGSMKAKASIRAAANVLGFSWLAGDKLAKMTLEPIAGKPVPLKTCYEKVPRLGAFRHGPDCEEKQILTWAEQIENRLRSFGTHASGIVISADPVTQTIPLYPGKDKAPTAQFEMNTVEECGLITFDFLGLRALTTIKRCTDLIKERHGITIDPLQIPVDDDAVYDQLQTGDVTGVFQLEGSSGMRDLVVQIKPRSLDDLALLVAIYRPGPLESTMLQHYLKVQAGQADPHYIIPELEPILKVTDGMLIFQEQILEICRQLAGYSLAEADLMRRAVGKKKKKEMDAQHGKFIEGMMEKDIVKSDAQNVWEDIESFASYGFNKAHAACYGYIGYQMAYLKTHYPLEFLCSCLISDSDEVDKIIQYIAYCKDKNIEVLGPSVNESQYSFAVAGEKSIRFGLSAIKNLGKPVQEIITEREENGLYKDILDFAERVDLSKINRKKIESLVLAGAFDSLGDYTRQSLLDAVDEVLRHKEEHKRWVAKDTTYIKKLAVWVTRELQLDDWEEMTLYERRQAKVWAPTPALAFKKPNKLKLPALPDPALLPCIPPAQEMEQPELLGHEKELMGYYVSGHPLDNRKEKGSYTIAQIKELAGEKKIQPKARVTLVAIPNVIKEITTKKAKQKMAYVDLEDKTGTIQSVVFSGPYAKAKELIDIQTPAYYDGEVEVIESDTDQVIKIRVSRVRMLPSIRAYRNRPIKITVPIATINQAAEHLSEIHGNDFKVKLTAISEEGNQWQFGVFSCCGERTALKKQLKEFK